MFDIMNNTTDLLIIPYLGLYVRTMLLLVSTSSSMVSSTWDCQVAWPRVNMDEVWWGEGEPFSFLESKVGERWEMGILVSKLYLLPADIVVKVLFLVWKLLNLLRGWNALAELFSLQGTYIELDKICLLTCFNWRQLSPSSVLKCREIMLALPLRSSIAINGDAWLSFWIKTLSSW